MGCCRLVVVVVCLWSSPSPVRAQGGFEDETGKKGESLFSNSSEGEIKGLLWRALKALGVSKRPQIGTN